MKKAGSLLLVAVLLLALGVFAAGPYRATAAIGASIRTQDAAALQRQVDFPAVRASLKAQLHAAISARAAADRQQNPFAELASRIALSLVDGVVDAFVTPAGLAGLASGRAGGRSEDGAGTAEPFAGAEKAWESHDRFVIRVPSDNGSDVVFVLTRDGLDWTMTDIRLPAAKP